MEYDEYDDDDDDDDDDITICLVDFNNGTIYQ